MQTYEFTLVLDAEGRTLDQVEKDLYGCCDDALLSFGNGVVELDFTREASSWLDAFASAIEDVCEAGYTITRLGPDLISTPEVANLLDVTRANVLQLMKGRDEGGRGEGDFARPIDRLGDRPIFRFRDVAEWATRHREFPPELFFMANGIAYGNNVLDRYRLSNRKLSGQALVKALGKAEPRVRSS